MISLRRTPWLLHGLNAYDAGELALAVGAEDSSADYRAALDLAMAAGRVSWPNWATYGLPPRELADFEAGEERTVPDRQQLDIPEAASEVARLVIEIKRSVSFIQVPSNRPDTAARSTADPLESLKRLAELHNAGVVDDNEFREKMAELMARI
jgi:hypothetical protein